MGILNVTSDSFFDGGRYQHIDQALAQTEKMVVEGAAIIDIGAMSSRPGSMVIDPKEEAAILNLVIPTLIAHFPNVIWSVDTLHASTARFVADQGVHIINDISGGHFDPKMLEVICDRDLAYVAMHMKGTPTDMMTHTNYQDLIMEVLSYFVERKRRFEKMGIKDYAIDLGFGFSKDVEQNYELFSRISDFQIFDRPILVGVSRKSMIYKILGTSANEALNGTTALHMAALMAGADILRVHDVKEASECVKLYVQCTPRSASAGSQIMQKS